MARKYRIIVPERPHHVIQRGNRRQQVFFFSHDKKTYLSLLKEQTEKYNVKVFAYCLMDNHVHLILMPYDKGSLSKAVAETNRRFSCMINNRYQWRGYLWQGRFLSSVIDEIYFLRVLHYVENNPVRAKIVKNAWQYPWSSAMAHITKEKNPILCDFPESEIIKDWKSFLTQPIPENILHDIRQRNQRSLPIAEKPFIEKLAKEYNIDPNALSPRPSGRPLKI